MGDDNRDGLETLVLSHGISLIQEFVLFLDTRLSLAESVSKLCANSILQQFPGILLYPLAELSESARRAFAGFPRKT